MVNIAVYSIAKDEQDNVEGWVESALDADHILLVDTGSSDETLKTADTVGLDTASISIQPFRFDAAFNAALALVPDDIDIAIPLHLDERLHPGWRPALEHAWDMGGRQFTFTYNWGVGLTFRHDRIHARHGYQWKYPAHECLVGGPGPLLETDVVVTQVRDPNKDRSQDSGLIELGYQENPQDPRPMYYWARQLYYEGRWEESRALFEHYLVVGSYGQERSEACRMLARMVYTHDRESWLLRACAEAPLRREPWVELMDFYLSLGSEYEAAFAARRAMWNLAPDAYNSFHIEDHAWDNALLIDVARGSSPDHLTVQQPD